MPTSPEGESEIIKAEYTHKHFYYKSQFHFYISYFLEALDAKIYFICTFQAFLSKNAFLFGKLFFLLSLYCLFGAWVLFIFKYV